MSKFRRSIHPTEIPEGTFTREERMLLEAEPSNLTFEECLHRWALLVRPFRVGAGPVIALVLTGSPHELGQGVLDFLNDAANDSRTPIEDEERWAVLSRYFWNTLALYVQGVLAATEQQRELLRELKKSRLDLRKRAQYQEWIDELALPTVFQIHDPSVWRGIRRTNAPLIAARLVEVRCPELVEFLPNDVRRKLSEREQ
ncbi:MAG: hypothetical protein LVQ64_00920 [Thermoplasmatales archaeon]|nr:hypothetical protein [Thermoplasmatales archaeon]